MLRMAVRWREQNFDCELQNDGGAKWLYVFDGPELVWRESIVSLAAAYAKAREVADKLSGRVARRA
jgi:hypothetical protein